MNANVRWDMLALGDVIRIGQSKLKVEVRVAI